MGDKTILVVEDRESLRKMLSRALEGEGYRVTAAASGEAAFAELRNGAFDLVLTDLKLPGMSGLDVLREARKLHPGQPVVVLTAYGTVGDAVQAMKLGALDFLEKPVELDDLFSLVAESLRDGGGDGEAFDLPGGVSIVGRHPTMRTALRLLKRVAGADSTVLLTGESGTGKELFARALHSLSGRRSRPFVAVNCAAIPAELMENELFGHEKGAFTGAHRREPGRFELAEGGTLLLDEIGELPPGVQGKVLRVLEERTYERVGSGRTRTADVRIVAATNRDLERMVQDGEFRSDLFYRLNVFPVELPPLRERATDIDLLARHLLRTIGRRHGRESLRLTAAAEDRLRSQPWPGNVRQLANVLERAVILSEGDEIGAAALEQWLEPLGPRSDEEAIRRALVDAEGDKKSAARTLGVSYRTLQRRIRELDLEGFPHYRS